jgi:putative transposase
MDRQEIEAILTSLHRGAPFGSPHWVRRTASKLNLESTLRPRGRPKRPIESLSPRYRRHVERRADKSG